jgi:hypothetical protein
MLRASFLIGLLFVAAGCASTGTGGLAARGGPADPAAPEAPLERSSGTLDADARAPQPVADHPQPADGGAEMPHHHHTGMSMEPAPPQKSAGDTP